MSVDEPRRECGTSKPLDSRTTPEISHLRQQGYPDAEIATKVGLSPAYLQNLLFLLERGEERLLAAVDNGAIPIAVAISIARSSDDEVQTALADAYADGSLKGKQLALVRKLIERRNMHGRRRSSGVRASAKSKRLTSEQLRKMYQRESEKQQLLAKKADLAHARLAFVINALRALMQSDEFVELLEQEGLTTLPRIVEQRINGERS
jgi:ParB family chromosome partitioning protein